MATPQNAKTGRIYMPFTNEIKSVNLRMSSQDISNWKRAIDAARSVTNPKRRLLLEMYNNIVIDGHLESVIEKRRIGITNKKLLYNQKDNKEENEFVRDWVINTPWMHDLKGHLQDRKAWGFTLAELIPEQGVISRVELADRLCVLPEKNMLLYDAMNETDGIDFTTDPMYSKYMLYAGGKKTYGKLMTAAQYVIYKRGGFGDWAQFAELFGMPFREGKYNPYDPESRKKLDEALREMGGAGYVVIPDGTSIQFHDANQAGKSEVFNDLIKVCNEEMSKIFLGGTMTVDNGSSRSQSEVHQQGEEDIVMSDMIELEFFFNWELRDKLLGLGYKIPEGQFKFSDTQTIPLEKRIEMDEKLSKEIEIPAEYWYENYGIPTPEGGAKLKLSYNMPPEEVKEEEKKKEEKPKEKTPQEKGGGGKIKASAMRHEHNCCPVVMAAYEDIKLTADEERLIKAIYENQGKAYDPATLHMNIDKIKEGLQKGFPLSLGYNEPDYLAATMMELNINRFGFDKNLAQIYALNQALDINESFGDFKSKALEILGTFNHHNLETEYNLAVASAQNAAAWNRQKTQQNEYPFLRYQTVGDDRVRAAHQELDGKIFRVDDPSWRGIYPPNGHGCRCEMIQMRRDEVSDRDVIDGTAAKGLLAEEWEKMQKGGFAFNRGDIPVVFDLNKGYITQLPEADRLDFNKLTYKDAGLADYSTFKSKMPLLQTTEQTAKSILEKWEKTAKDMGGKKVSIYKDYSGRPIALGSKTLERHLQGKYLQSEEGRNVIFGNVKEVLAKPSEVYLFKKPGGYGYKYIKFYKNEVLVVETDISASKGLEIGTWYRQKIEEIELRKGMLIKKGKY